MRPLLALLLCATIFGAVGGYLRFLHGVQAGAAAQAKIAIPEERASGKFSLEIALTFDAGGDDAFALEAAQSTSVLVQMRGRDLLRLEETVAAGTPVAVEDVQGIVAGANEFYVDVRPSAEALAAAHAVRVRVLRDGNPLAEQILWSEPGLPVRGTVRIEIKPSAIEDDEHDRA